MQARPSKPCLDATKNIFIYGCEELKFNSQSKQLLHGRINISSSYFVLRFNGSMMHLGMGWWIQYFKIRTKSKCMSENLIYFEDVVFYKNSALNKFH